MNDMREMESIFRVTQRTQPLTKAYFSRSRGRVTKKDSGKTVGLRHTSCGLISLKLCCSSYCFMGSFDNHVALGQRKEETTHTMTPMVF